LSEYVFNKFTCYRMNVFSCRRGRFWWRRKCRAKYRGPWWRWPAVSVTVTYSQVHDWVSVDSDDTPWSDTTLCHAIQHGHRLEVDRLCYSSDSTLYNKMPVGKLVKSRISQWFCHCTCTNCCEVSDYAGACVAIYGLVTLHILLLVTHLLSHPNLMCFASAFSLVDVAKWP